MRTELLHNRVKQVLNRCQSPSARLTEFYETAVIADMAIREVLVLRKEMQEIIELSKVHGYAGKMRMKHIAEMALRRAE